MIQRNANVYFENGEKIQKNMFVKTQNESEYIKTNANSGLASCKDFDLLYNDAMESHRLEEYNSSHLETEEYKDILETNQDLPDRCGLKALENKYSKLWKDIEQDTNNVDSSIYIGDPTDFGIECSANKVGETS